MARETCAAWLSLGGYAVVCIAVGIFAVVAHVAGNSIGTQMRAKGTKEASRAPASSVTPKQDVSKHFAPPTRLERKDTFGWLHYIVTGIGGVIGGAIGGYALAAAQWDKATVSSVIVGVVASGVISGFVTYLSTSFLRVSVTAVADAQSKDRRP